MLVCPTCRFSRTTRLLACSSSGYDAFQASGGVTALGPAPPAVVRNRKISPVGRTKACRPISTRDSILTARIVNRSCASCSRGFVSNSSNLDVTTSPREKSRARSASRRKTDFLVFASTIRTLTSGKARARGIAGEPPPLPISRRLRAAGLTCDAANSGSMRSRSSASGPYSERFNPVRLIFLFQVARSR